MPIEHINKTDTLNEGREKLNNAITAFNETVVEGDSSVEAAQARVDEKGVPHPTLKARIDDGMNSVNQQLAETATKEELSDLDDNKADKGALSQVANSKRDKDIEIGMADLDQETREAFTGGSVAVVGENSVGTENLRNNAVTREKMNKDFMVNAPWVDGAESDLDYVWDEGNYMVGSSVKNMPVGVISMLDIKRSKTTSAGNNTWITQTITTTEAYPKTYKRVLLVKESTSEIDYIRGWSRSLSGKVMRSDLDAQYNVALPWIADDTFDLDNVWVTGTYMVNNNVINNPTNSIAILNISEGKTTDGGALSWVKQEITLAYQGKDPVTYSRVLQVNTSTETLNWKTIWKTSNEGHNYIGMTWVSMGTSITAYGEYVDYVVNELGLVKDNRGVGGGGLTSFAGAGNTTMQAIEAIEDFNGIVSIEIGPNDWLKCPLGSLGDTTVDTWYGAVDKACRTLSKRTSARPFIITSTTTAFSVGADFDESQRRSVYYKSAANDKMYVEYVNAAKEVAQHYSIPVCDVFGESGLGSYHQNSQTLSDHIHLTDLGGEIYGNHIINFLKYKFSPFPLEYENPLANT